MEENLRKNIKKSAAAYLQTYDFQRVESILIAAHEDTYISSHYYNFDLQSRIVYALIMYFRISSSRFFEVNSVFPQIIIDT